MKCSLTFHRPLFVVLNALNQRTERLKVSGNKKKLNRINIIFEGRIPPEESYGRQRLALFSPAS